ncbi:LOW QUALITY PROTEIN: obscurin-like [Centruroides vittatus]|uniref:LOW QUALITY PROTEIN: obscurin-like n=1 Tax=Centruroides vittatus TaxID=120091 RepID=UPI00350F41AF
MTLDPGKLKPRRHSSPGCRITQKSASMDDHHYFPSSSDFPRFRSNSGCRITEKNKWMGGYQFTYPVMGGGMSVSESEFHCRVTAKYRAMSGYKYVYPLPGKVDVSREDLVSFRDEKVFVPREVDKIVPGGVKEVLKARDGEEIYISSHEGELMAAAVKPIAKKKKYRRSKTLPTHLEATPTTGDRDESPEGRVEGERGRDTKKKAETLVEEVEEKKEEIIEESKESLESVKGSWLDKYKAEWKTFSVESKYASNCLLDFGEYRKYCEEEPGIDFSQFEIREEEEEEEGEKRATHRALSSEENRLTEVTEEERNGESVSLILEKLEVNGLKTEVRNQSEGNTENVQLEERKESVAKGEEIKLLEREENVSITVTEEKTRGKAEVEGKPPPPIVLNDTTEGKSRILWSGSQPRDYQTGGETKDASERRREDKETVEQTDGIPQTDSVPRENGKESQVSEQKLNGSSNVEEEREKEWKKTKTNDTNANEGVAISEMEIDVFRVENVNKDGVRVEEIELSNKANVDSEKEAKGDAAGEKILSDLMETRVGEEVRKGSVTEENDERKVSGSTEKSVTDRENTERNEEDFRKVVEEQTQKAEEMEKRPGRKEETEVTGKKTDASVSSDRSDPQRDDGIARKQENVNSNSVSEAKTKPEEKSQENRKMELGEGKHFFIEVGSESKESVARANNADSTREEDGNVSLRSHDGTEEREGRRKEEMVISGKEIERKREETEGKSTSDQCINGEKFSKVNKAPLKTEARKENEGATENVESAENVQKETRKEAKREDTIKGAKKESVLEKNKISDEHKTESKVNREFNDSSSAPEVKDEEKLQERRGNAEERVGQECNTSVSESDLVISLHKEREEKKVAKVKTEDTKESRKETGQKESSIGFGEEKVKRREIVPARVDQNGCISKDFVAERDNTKQFRPIKEEDSEQTIQEISCNTKELVEENGDLNGGIQRTTICTRESEDFQSKLSLKRYNRVSNLDKASTKIRVEENPCTNGDLVRLHQSEASMVEKIDFRYIGEESGTSFPSTDEWTLGGERENGLAIRGEEIGALAREKEGTKDERDCVDLRVNSLFSAFRRYSRSEEQVVRVFTSPPETGVKLTGSECSWVREETEDRENIHPHQRRDVYVAVMDFNPVECDIGAIPMRSGQEVEIIDSSKPRKWLVRTRSLKGGESKEGWVPTCYLEKKTKSITDITTQADTRSDPKEREAATRREAIVKELVETEEDFARDMQYVVDNYYLEMDNTRMPKDLRDQRESLFMNFKPICEFHNNVLIKGVQYYAKEPALLGKTFLRLERDFDMHVNYCRDEAHAQQLLSTGPLKEYFNEHSRRIGDDKTLSEHLKLPIQRINDYQLLLRELIKYTARLKEDTNDLQKALDFMVCIPQRSSDLKYLNAMQGYKGNIHKLGRLLKHGWLEVIEPTKTVQERYVFLFKAHMFITDIKRITTDNDTYIVKNIVKLQDVEIVEKANGDDRAFKAQHKNKDKTDYPIIFRAANSDQREAWIKEMVTRSVIEDLGEDEPELAPDSAQKVAFEKEMENTESDIKSVELEEERTDAKIPSLTSDIKIELPEEEATTNITESLRSESLSSLEDIEANPKGNPGKPQFQKPLKGITCMQGESATFECVVASTPPATVKWLKNNKPIAKSQRIKITSQGDKYTLSIKEALPEDVGLYTVMANNAQGLVACSATLNVKQGGLGVPKEDSRPTTPGGTELPHAPVFKVKLKDTELLEGTSVRFELVVRGNPQPKITFYKDGKELKEDERVRISYETKEVFELILDHVTGADAGEYSCVAVNSEGKDTTTGVIKVTKHKILFRGLEEELERPPTPKPFKWFKDGRDFEASDRFQVSFSEEEDTLALVFQRVTPDDAGLYTCVASTSSGNKISCSAELTVQGSVRKLLRDPEAPKIKASISDVEVSEGASAMLELKVTGYPKPNVTWFKDGKEIKASDRVRFLFEDDESYTLIIKNVKKEDAGKYKVTAKNDMGEVEESCKLTVTCPPSFRKKLKDMAVMTNEPVRFEVEVEGKPTPEVKWYKDGQQLSESDRIKMLQEKEEIFAMMIDKVKPEDSGNYSCVLTNESGSQAGYSNLVVNAPPSFTKEMKNVECSEEETVSFSLKVSGNPKPTLKWLKDGKELNVDGRHVKVTEEDNTYTLTIDKVKKEDVGKYACEIANAHGKATTCGNLSTKGKPEFTKKLSDKEVKEGDVNVEFNVVVKGSPTPTVKWSVNGNVVTEKKNYKLVSEESKGSYTLKIEKVTLEESGKYTCEASNPQGSASTSGILTVCKPLSFTQTLKNTEVSKGEKVSLGVKFSGEPKPTVKWSKDGKELKAGGKHARVEESADSSTLVLDEALKTDEGQYKCELSNKFGTESTSGSLTVKVKDDSVAPSFIKKLQDQLSVVGDAARFEVRVTGKPKPKIVWSKDGAEMKESAIVKMACDGDDYSLTVRDLKVENSGKYSCQASNEKGSATDQAVLTVKEPTKPVIEGGGDKEVEEGGAVKFALKITGFPIPEVKWYKNEKVIQESDQIVVAADKDANSYSLTVRKVKQEDVATYACVANNNAGTARSESKLSIKVTKPVESKPAFVKKLKPTDLIIGQPGKLEAKVSGEPKPKITWLKNGEEVSLGDHVTAKQEPDGTVALVFDCVSPDDVGTFSIMAVNDSGDAMSTAQINAKPPPGEKPKFIQDLKATQLQDGQAGRLQIKVSGEPTPSIKWFKDGNEILPSNHYTIMEEPDGTVNLLIDKVGPEDAGKYSVVVSNDKGEARSEAPVTTISPVTGKKPELLVELKSVNVTEGEPLRLEAKISGEPSSVKWLRNGEEIPVDERVSAQSQPDGTFCLVVNKALPQDGGKYSIVATNALGKAYSSSLVEVKAIPKEKPQILGTLEPLVVKKGETGKLTAKVLGENPQVKWMKDDKEVVPSDRIKVMKEEDGTVALVIDNMTSEDAGKYSLVAANPHGENRSSAPISVTHPPCFVKTLKPLKVVEGYPAQIQVQVVGIPTPGVKWLRNNTEVKADDDRISIVSDDEGNASLLIKKALPEDEGDYKCVASNTSGDSDSEASLTVRGRSKGGETESVPMVVSPLKDVTVKEGEPMVLETQISGFPIPEVVWYCNDQPLHASESVLPTFDGEKAVLEIKESVAKHAGTFECRLKNPLGETSSKGNVKVVERQAPRFVQRFYDAQINVEQPTKLSCRVRGDPPLEVTWYCNGELIQPGIKYDTQQDGETCTLTFCDPNVRDGGIYECRVKNAAGEDVNSARVTFSEKPEKGEAPLFLKKIGDAEALEGMTVKFTACIAGTPQPEVKWFKDEQLLESSPRCKMEQESSGILRLIVRDVDSTDFGQYTVEISNVHGKESCSAKMRPDSLDAKYPTTPIGDQFIDFDKFRKSGAPVPLPEKPYIVRMSDKYLTLGWKPSVPTSPRVPVTYQVEKALHPDGEWSTYKSGIKNCLCDVLNLEPDQDYKFRIRVENKHGVSDPSPYKTARRSKLLETKPVSRYEPMDFEIEHPELEKHAEAPRFLRKEEEAMYGIRDQPVTIEFWVYGYPEPEITWYFDGKPMEKDKYDFLRDRNGKVAVFLPKMTDSEVGTYVCHATNDLGDVRQKIHLQIAEAPSFIQRLEFVSIMNRRSGRMHCRVTGVPYPKIKWYKDWFPIYDSERYKILWEEPDKCTLFINGAILKDSGLYSCSASNLAATVSCSAMVSVEESELEHVMATYSRPNIVKARTKPFEDFYDIGDEVGRGTQAIVYHAVQRITGNSYAAKMMHGKGKVRELMNAEMDIMNHLCHPKLVRLLDAFESKSALTLVTDLCGGGELLDGILKRGKLTERDVANYIKQILEGLEHMHGKNIGHLGLTIGDVLVNHVNSDLIKVGDFGLAAHLHPEKEYFLDYGHPEFVAPEIANKQAVTLSADMWSVGVITYLLLSGISPFLAENDMETLKKVQQGKINFFPDAFTGVSDDAKDFMSKLLVFDPNERMEVKVALQHRWLTGEGIADGDIHLNNLERLKDYHRKWKDWYSNASCKRFYRRRPLESCFTHPSKMIYPPGEEYTPPSSPEPELDRTRVKPAEFDDTYKQRISREPVDFRSETNYQNGPDTYLLQHRDTEFPLRIREYLRIGASLSPSLANSLGDTHWGDNNITVRERRRFVDIMDEEITDERTGRGTRTIPMRLHHELGTTGYAREQMEMLKKEVWKDKGSREVEIGYAPYFREKMRDVVIEEGQDAVFSCYAVGDPQPDCSWFRNDGILIESSRIQIKQSKDGKCELRLTPGKGYDVGVYKCVARNLHGESTCRARMKLGSVPDRPDTPEVDQYSDNAVYITWRTPKYTGNTTILCYCVEYHKKGEAEWTKVANNVTHEFYVVHKLSPSTTYQFRVSAKNKFGWGFPSIPTENVTTMAEGAPKIRITKARKYQQERTEQNEEIEEEEEVEETEIDYNIENNPIPIVEGNPSDLYNFVSEITRGKFSIMVKSWVKDLQTTLITKIIVDTEGNEKAGRKEYEIHNSLRHKNIVELMSASYKDNVTILVMEKLSGMDVLSYLSKHTEYNEDTVAKIMIQVLNALEYLHFRGICYIELQPDNVVMIDEKYPRIKLVDFGSARKVPKAGGKIEVKGRLEYLAPEVICQEDVHTTTDVWAVGVLTYILLSGCSPFRGENDDETTSNVTFVRYCFDSLHKEVTAESTRFLIQTFKKCPLKRPTVAECLDNKWLSPTEFMIRKRESAVFLAHRLHEFSEAFHAEKQSSTSQELEEKFGMAFSRAVSLEVDAYEEI